MVSDECGTIQSQINKNLEVLDKLLIQKEFLDDLTPPAEKERLAKLKEQREETRALHQQIEERKIKERKRFRQ